MDFDTTKEYFFEERKNGIIKHGMEEILSRSELPLHPVYGNKCITARFYKKNTNRYFKKHLGFTFRYHSPNDWYRHWGHVVKIHDPKKFLVFVLKYGLIGHEFKSDEDESKDSGKTKK